jgi:DNA repair protein RadD
MSLILRPYQCAAVNSIYEYFDSQTGNPLIVIPTAGGKSSVMAGFIRGVLHEHQDQRMLVVTHVRELIKQNHDELLRMWPEAPAGIYSAGLGRRESDAPILFCGIQSVHRRAAEIGHVDLAFIDEAHLIPRTSNTMYRRFLDDLRIINPYLKVIGLTATPYRLDSGKLHEGEGALFTDIAYEASVRTLIDEGYLSRMVSKRTKTQLDVRNVGVQGGDFIGSQLERAVDTDAITKAATQEIMKFGHDRRSWLVFCAGVGHAHHVRDAIRAAGVSCETIVGTTPAPERDALIASFKAGEIRCLTNANVLTTGFNAPSVDLIAMLRPTQSAGLYVQMVGRGSRLAPGKENCMVLDFAGNIARHGPIDIVKARSKAGDSTGTAPTKVCPECDSILHAAMTECPDCGHVFMRSPPKIEPEASELDVVSSGAAQAVPVTQVNYSLHHKPGKPTSLRVDYQSGLARHSEFLCFEHEGYARAKARRWWAIRGPGLPTPQRAVEAMAMRDRLRVPTHITVRQDGHYTKVVGASF